MGGEAEEIFKAPYWLVHRADLHGGLLEACLSADVKISTASSVEHYDFENATITITGGEKVSGDLLVCADGIKSIARQGITGRVDHPVDTGDVAYRILIPGDKLREDPDLKDLIENPCTTSWCGPDAHIVCYPIRNVRLALPSYFKLPKSSLFFSYCAGGGLQHRCLRDQFRRIQRRGLGNQG
jgi:salicylate hydroxylase